MTYRIHLGPLIGELENNPWFDKIAGIINYAFKIYDWGRTAVKLPEVFGQILQWPEIGMLFVMRI